MNALTFTMLYLASYVVAAPIRRQGALSQADVFAIVSLIPDLGVEGPLPSTGHCDCFGPVVGANGQNISVPCSCPPNRAVYVDSLVENALAGFAVNNTGVSVDFPLGNTTQDAEARITAAEITLQNLFGPGRGCPASSTRLGALSAALAQASNPTTLPPTTDLIPSSLLSTSVTISSTSARTSSTLAVAASSTPSASGLPTPAQIPALAPPLGVSAPLPPTGFGDCVGPVPGADGRNISVPCTCPPAPAVYIAALTANVLAGHALNNTGVPVTFPLGNTTDDAHARIMAAAITLQNLEGAGVGCPLSSTTLGAQSAALSPGA